MTAREAMPAELRPCPFCNNADIRLNEPSKYHRYGCINCPACMAFLPGAVSDQNELIECWNTRAASQPAPAPVVPDGYVLVPQKALDWLNGAGPDDNGKWFGEVADEVEELDKPRRFKRTYWWRTYFRQMIDAAPAMASQMSQTPENAGGKS